MRISDWSSDVCSSDLAQEGRVRFATAFRLEDRGNGGDRSRPDVCHAAGRPRRDRAAHRSAATERARHAPATQVQPPAAEPESDRTRPEAAICELTLRLLEQADALIEGFRPGVMERLGLGPGVCLQRNPHLVYGRMTGWGQTGPLSQAAAHDLNYIALTGALHAIGRQEQLPTACVKTRLSARAARASVAVVHAAARRRISSGAPSMVIARFRLKAVTESAISALTAWRPRQRKRASPIIALTMPNGCSARQRRSLVRSGRARVRRASASSPGPRPEGQWSNSQHTMRIVK